MEKNKKKLAGKPDPDEYELKKKILVGLNERASNNEIDLFYGDESGFSLVPTVPYAWQPKGEYIKVESSLSQRINVLGFLDKKHNLKCMTFQDSINTDCVISAIDHLFENVTKKTWLVLDNAPVHRSNKFKEKIQEWESKNIFILFLPSYSPELNIIEILWRFIKYHWLPFSAYENFDKLKSKLDDVLVGYGTNYNITFA